MNVYDSARMADVLAPLGFVATDVADEADMILLNTCHIREKAAEKLFSDLGRLRVLKTRKADNGDNLILGVAGCVAQAEGAEIMRRAPFVDLVLGPQTYHRLPEMVARLARGEGPVLDTEFPIEPKFDFLPETEAPQGVSAFLSVQEGCDKFCTFCVVPYTRGAEFSRPAASIIAEAKRLVAGGTRELTLLGQNVNAYHGDGTDGTNWNLARLLRALAAVPGIERLRYTTSHPRDMDDDLIEAHGDLPELMPFLHLPVQSGSDRILEAMNRGHTADDYRRIIDRLRGVRPDIAFSSDFIVGFPGETDTDFAATLDLIRDVGLAQAYTFKYSPRSGTPAATMAKHVADDVASDRLQTLQALMTESQDSFNRSCVGKVLPVLFERSGRYAGQLVGRSPYAQGVHATASARCQGTVMPVRITGVSSNSLSGEVETMEVGA